MSKPREFWINKVGLTLDTNPPHTSSTAYWQETSDCIHVIEKSAYDELQQQLKEAREENEELMREDYWERRCEAAKAQADKLAQALEKIIKYNFRGSGPSGCDNHCINHPCGPCLGYHNEKWIAKKALAEYRSSNE